MAENTTIEWTDATVNFWWGCTKVGPGCDHCYAETWAKRTGDNIWGAGVPRRKIKSALKTLHRLDNDYAWWAARHFPGVPIITCRSADKRDYGGPGDVLIDDWPQHRHRWIEMGGVFISHFDARSSLAALWAHYPELAA